MRRRRRRWAIISGVPTPEMEKMDSDLIDALTQARRSGVQIAQPNPDWRPGDEDTAYRTMLEVAHRLDWAPLGWKIAGSDARLRQRLRTDGLVFGRTFQRFLTPSPITLKHGELLDPIVECEFFFRIGCDLPASRAEHTEDRVREVVETVHVGVEVGECRFANANLPSPLLLRADGYGSGRYVIGPEVPDWQAMLATPVDVMLLKNGAPRSRGSSMDVMGHPLRPLVWLANRLASLGIGLARGDMISTGSCTGMVKARPGDQMVARFEGIGDVSISFE